MREIELTPGYSTREISGKCLKCLADHEYTECLRALLGGDTDNQDLRRTYEALVTFLQSPDMKRLRQESERLLSDGRRVTVRISFEDGKPTYGLEIGE